jgi:hypothetical protein
MFNARQGKGKSIASWGNKIDELQSDLRESARKYNVYYFRTEILFDCTLDFKKTCLH